MHSIRTVDNGDTLKEQVKYCVLSKNKNEQYGDRDRNNFIVKGYVYFESLLLDRYPQLLHALFFHTSG